MQVTLSSNRIFVDEIGTNKSRSSAIVNTLSTYGYFQPFANHSFLTTTPNNSHDITTSTTSTTSNSNICVVEADPAAVCIECSTYLNLFASIDLNTSEWICPMCKTLNPPIYSQQTLSGVLDPKQKETILKNTFRELSESSIDYVEYSQPSLLRGPLESQNHHNPIIYVMALPTDTLSDDGLLDLILHAMTNLSSTKCFISILIYSRSINVLRLSDLATNRVPACDVIPGYGKYAHKLLDSIAKRSYLATPDDVIKFSDSLQSVFKLLRTKSYDNSDAVEDTRSDDGICSAESIIDYATNLNKSTQSNIRLISFNTRSFPLDQAKSSIINSQSHNISQYSLLGADALGAGVFIDLVCAGLRGIHFDKLTSLASATGGVVISGSSFGEVEIMTSLMQVLTHSKDDAILSSLKYVSTLESCPVAVVEVRTSGGVADVELFMTGYESNSSDSSIVGFVDTTHLEQYCNRSELYAGSITNKRNNTTVIDTKPQRLTNALVLLPLKRNMCNSSAALCVRKQLHSSAMFKITSRHRQIIPQPTRDEPVLEGLDNKTKPNIGDAVVIQLIVRFSLDNKKITRVHTFTVAMSSDTTAFIRDMEPDIHALVLSTFLVRSYHRAVNSYFNGVYIKNYEILKPEADPRTPFLNAINMISAYSDVLVQNNPSNAAIIIDKLRIIIRYLYHLRQCPLLDGDTLQLQESYLLRCQFFSNPALELRCFIQPRVQLLVLGLTSPSINHSAIETNAFLQSINTSTFTSSSNGSISAEDLLKTCLYDISSDSMALLPFTIALIDCGDIFVIRPGDGLNEDDLYQGISVKDILSTLHQLMVKKVSIRRHVPRVCVIKCGGYSSSTGDRLMISRLCPSHEDPSETIILAIPELLAITPEYRSSLHKSFVHTEQSSFNQYLRRYAPSFSYTTSSISDSQPMNMQKDSLGVQANSMDRSMPKEAVMPFPSVDTTVLPKTHIDATEMI